MNTGLALPTKAKEKKTDEELAAMIHYDLSQIEGCPRRGVKVTVYGLSPWKKRPSGLGKTLGPFPSSRPAKNGAPIIRLARQGCPAAL
jgi:hypothetical protein